MRLRGLPLGLALRRAALLPLGLRRPGLAVMGLTPALFRPGLGRTSSGRTAFICHMIHSFSIRAAPGKGGNQFLPPHIV